MLWITGRVDTFYYIKNFCFMKATDNLLDFKRKLKGFKEFLFSQPSIWSFQFCQSDRVEAVALANRDVLARLDNELARVIQES